MGQPVKLSDALVLDARLVGKIAHRSIPGQVEFWAGLGRAIEPLLQGDRMYALSRRAAAAPLSHCLETADSEAGHSRTKAFLHGLPFPHYEAAPGAPGYLVRIDADGRRTRGRFVNRVFTPVTRKSRKRAP